MNASEAAVFSQPGWWDGANRAYASLRAVNELRLQFLHTWLGTSWPWADATVVDLGCGGGLMAVPIARTGARVLGIDGSRPALQEARAQGGGAVFVTADLAAVPLRRECADLVLLCDVVEHVQDPAALLAAAAQMLRPRGRVFVHTINRTLRARLLAVTLGEGLGLIPRGTHDARRFVRPIELQSMAAAAGLRVDRWFGERPDLWRSLRERCVRIRPGRSLAVSYGCGLVKEGG